MALCDRFGCLPSQLEAEDARLLRLLAIEALAHPPEEADVGLEAVS